MSISELCIYKIFSEEIKTTEFVKIEKYKYLTLAANSDTCIYLELQYSHDGYTTGYNEMYYLNGKKWIIEKNITPILPFVRIRLMKADVMFPGTNLIVHTSGRMQ